jgi:hypothetical protein
VSYANRLLITRSYFLQGEDGDIDTTLTYQYMSNWEMRKENMHTDAWKKKLAAAGKPTW